MKKVFVSYGMELTVDNCPDGSVLIYLNGQSIPLSNEQRKELRELLKKSNSS